MQAIETGLLAYGMSGKLFHAPFLAAHPGFTLRAVTERTEQRAPQDYPAVRSYSSVAELLADPAIELVVVNTPNNTHFEFAQQALRAGKHVLIEKPLATTVAEVTQLYETARQTNCYVLAYQNRRWDSDFGEVRQVVQSGVLGQLIEVHFRFDRYKLALNKKQFKETLIPGSGLLYDLGPHLLDQAISLFGQPLASRLTRGKYRPGSQVDDYFTMHLHYPNGLNVFVSASLLVAQPQPAYVLHGTQGSFTKRRTDEQEAQLQQGILPTANNYGEEAPFQGGALTLVGEAVERTILQPSFKGNYLELFEAMYQTIRNGAPYPIREEEIRWQIQLLSQADTPWL